MLALAKASGRLAKTDRIDAAVLAHFGQAMQPSAKPLSSEAQEALPDLVNRRQQVVEMLNSEQRRLHSVRNRTDFIVSAIERLKRISTPTLSGSNNGLKGWMQKLTN